MALQCALLAGCETKTDEPSAHRDGSVDGDLLSDHRSGGANETGGSGGAIHLDAGANKPLDAAFAVPPLHPRRLIVFTNEFGIYADPLAMKWEGTGDSENWERSLSDPKTTLSPTLEPLAAFRDRLLVVTGLGNHVVTALAQAGGGMGASWAVGTFHSSTLTGGGLETDRTARAPSLDFLIGAANTPPGGIKMAVTGFGLDVYPALALSTVTFDDKRNAISPTRVDSLRPVLFSGPTCSAPPPGPMRPGSVSSQIAQVVPVILKAFQCDITRVFTINVSLPYKDFEGDERVSFGQDCIAVKNSELARKCFTSYQLVLATELATIVRVLASAPEDDGTMLDNTAILWISTTGAPGHEMYPWNAILVAGENMGFRTGRYLHFAQTIPAKNAGGDTVLTGPAHNHLLVSIARAFGLQVDAVGARQVVVNGNTLDVTGPLPGVVDPP